jgi:hypothetical protein
MTVDVTVLLLGVLASRRGYGAKTLWDPLHISLAVEVFGHGLRQSMRLPGGGRSFETLQGCPRGRLRDDQTVIWLPCQVKNDRRPTSMTCRKGGRTRRRQVPTITTPGSAVARCSYAVDLVQSVRAPAARRQGTSGGTFTSPWKASTLSPGDKTRVTNSSSIDRCAHTRMVLPTARDNNITGPKKGESVDARGGVDKFSAPRRPSRAPTVGIVCAMQPELT